MEYYNNYGDFDQNNLKLFKKIGRGLKKIGKGAAKVGTGVVSGVTAPLRVVGRVASGQKLKGFKPIITKPKKIGRILKQAGGGAAVGGAAALTLVGAKKVGQGLKKIVKLGPPKKPSDKLISLPRLGALSDVNKDIGKSVIKGAISREIDNRFKADEVVQPDDPSIGYKELRIFKPAMSLAVRTKGLNPSSNVETLSNQFYDNVVRNTLEARNHADAYQTPKEIVIDAIVKYFISAKNKKDAGGELTKIDEIAAGGYELAQDSAAEVIEDKAKMGIGDWVVENKGLVIGVGVGIFVLIIVLIARK